MGSADRGARSIALAIALTFSLAHCGARTQLVLFTADASRFTDADAAIEDSQLPEDVTLPDCGAPLAPGTLRFRVAGIAGPMAADREGNWYAPRYQPDAGHSLVSIDACGSERWQRAIPSSVQPNGLVEARLGPRDQAVFSNNWFGGIDGQGYWVFGRDGSPAPAPMLVPNARIWGTVAIAPAGPLLIEVQSTGTTSASRLVEFDALGQRLREHPMITVATDGQVLSGRRVVSAESAYDLDSRHFVFQTETEIVDGTFRHALPVAPDGDRYYAMFFGVRTYLLAARSMADGHELWRVTLTDSPRGQMDMLAGAPVLTQGGLVVVYLNAGGVPEGGALMAFRRDGSPAWRVGATASRESFFDYSTHLAASDGMVYLAVGSSLFAVDESAGRVAWMVALPTPANRSAPMLAPTGDLALRTDANEMLVYATASRALASTGWPIVAGSAERRNAR